MRNALYIINRMTFAALVCVFVVFAMLGVSAADAEELTSADIFENIDPAAAKRLADGNYNTYNTLSDRSELVVKSDRKIGSMYIVFDRLYGEYTVENSETGESVICGKDGFLHAYIDVEKLLGETKSLKITFDSGDASLADIYVFSKGDVPAWVQKWESPSDGETDLLLLSSHSDDEQLFFAGILPYYAGELGLEVQVVYFTHHFDTHNRPHEQLNGLWTVGVKNYPIISEFPDLYSESLSYALAQYKWAGYTEDDFIEFQVEMIRRFKPFVVVGHDIKGEYGHGTHILNTDTLMKALELSADAKNYPESAKKYGVWEVRKTYIHLYEENKIVMDWDKPLEAFDGKTAYEVSVEGYGCHFSQHWTWFTRWLKGTDAAPLTAASQIKEYSPCEYGLYRSTVGDDLQKNDFFENIDLKKNVSDIAKMCEEREMKLSPVAGSQMTDTVFETVPDTGWIIYVILLIAFIIIISALCILLFRHQIFEKNRKNEIKNEKM